MVKKMQQVIPRSKPHHHEEVSGTCDGCQVEGEHREVIELGERHDKRLLLCFECHAQIVDAWNCDVPDGSV